MIPDETIEKVREAADIVQIIGEYVNLKRQGTDFRGPCPFHQGTHRNFSVSPKKGIYYCFVCHEGGDVFHFLQKRLGVEWPAAVRLVGEKCGVEVREVDTRREGPDPREPYWEVNAAAAGYFQRMLRDDPSGAKAREYLVERDIPRELADEIGIGFAPREVGLMRTYLNTLGFDDARLVEAGLMVVPEGATEARPRFRGRLIFPILDASGRTVGFGGRILGQGEPKYLNSAESPVFSKGKLLYGMNWAKNEIRKENRVLVVEGYFDAVRLLAAGIRCVVAPLGTALTADQAALLRRLTENVYLLYDSDKAGLTATFRAGDELLSHGMSVRVVTLPEGEDPDTFVRAKGAAALEAEIESAIDIFERKIQLLERGGWFAELQKKRRALDRLLPTLRATKDEIMRELYIGRASEVTGVSREVLERELKAKPPRGQSGERSITAPPQMAPRIRRGERRARHEEAGSSSERELVRAMLIKPALLESVAEKVDVESFRDPEYRAIYEALIQFGPDSTLEDLASVLEPDTIALMEDLASENMAKVEPGRNSEDSAGKTNQDTIAKTVQDSIAGLRAREIAERLAEIDRVFPLASAQEKDEMLAEKQELMKEMRGTGRQDYKAFRQRKWK